VTKNKKKHATSQISPDVKKKGSTWWFTWKLTTPTNVNKMNCKHKIKLENNIQKRICLINNKTIFKFYLIIILHLLTFTSNIKVFISHNYKQYYHRTELFDIVAVYRSQQHHYL